jgi:class 3 adenylate cyclase
MKRNSFQIQSLQVKLRSALLQNTVVKAGVQGLLSNAKTAGLLAKRGWNYVEDIFLRLQIRLKLSIIVGISIIGTTLIIGTIVTRLQEEELKLQAEALGHSIVVGLNSSAKDNLLLNSPSIIQDYVNNFTNLKIPGLERLFVVDRERTIVANLNSNELNKRISEEEWNTITKSDAPTFTETPTSLRFDQAIVVNKHEGTQTRKIVLGGASISFSKMVLLGPIDEIKSKILLYSFGVSILAIGFMFVVSKHIVKVIIVLSDAARRVGSGDLRVSVVTRMKDELGMLSREFNFMVVQIREKVEMQKFISKSAVEMIAGGKQATLGGSRNVICAVFTDVRGFTAFSESRSPEEVVETLNYYLDIQTRIIHEHGGIVDKFLGDGIMAIFSGDTMIIHAIEASIHIQKELAILNEERKRRNENVLAVGIGIASGIAVLGSIGSRDRMDFTAIGDTINLASRLCDIAHATEIFVTNDIANAVRKSFPSVSRGNIPIKGMKQEVRVYKIAYSLN